MQTLEARLMTSLITQSGSLGLQGLPTLPATNRSILDHEERLTVVTKKTGLRQKALASDQPPFLRSLLLKLTQLLSVFAAPFGYFETLSSFCPVAYTIYDIGPQIICYSLIPAETYSIIATFTQDLLIAKT
jgi:hypothetical protein